jgi:hypothetical protein
MVGEASALVSRAPHASDATEHAPITATTSRRCAGSLIAEPANAVSMKPGVRAAERD